MKCSLFEPARFSLRPAAIAAVIAAVLVPASVGHAQEYINASRTVAGGNPFTETINNNLLIGRDQNATEVPGVVIDVTPTGSLNGIDLYNTFVYSNSAINILGGKAGTLNLNGDNTVTISSGILANVSTNNSRTVSLQITGG